MRGIYSHVTPGPRAELKTESQSLGVAAVGAPPSADLSSGGSEQVAISAERANPRDLPNQEPLPFRSQNRTLIKGP
jgi:hypothetical protein